MKTLLIYLVSVCLLMGPAAAQDLPPASEPAMPKTLSMQSVLFDAEQLAGTKTWADGELQTELKNRGLRLTEDRLVHVTIRGPEGSGAVPVSLVTAVSGRDDISWRHLRDAWVPVDRLVELARSLPDSYFLERVMTPEADEVVGEGPEAVNSDSYRDGGANGAGRTIAIIDHGYDGLTEAWNNGDIPSPYTWHNFTPDPLESVTIHGTGCTEAAFDNCPGAAFHLYMVDSPTDYGPVVENAIANGVNVISMSLSGHTSGWHDNSGDACAAMNMAANNGLIVAVSAGNYAACHYQGGMNVGGDDWHDFSPTDETIDILIAAGASVSFHMQWNTTGDTYDYDLYLFDSSFNELASSTNPDNYFEWFEWANNTGSDQIVHLAVERYSGGNTEFEIFTHYGTWQEHKVAYSSTGSPSNSTHANVLSVGAVVWDDFDNPNGTGGIITSYSSNGPSNSGMILPDICGPTGCHGFVYPNGMGGTSNSTPNVAGAICAFWSADVQLSADAVRWLVLRQADMWRDWGYGGLDPVYGYGGMILHEFHPNTLWLNREVSNTSDLRTLPLYTVNGANYWAVNGGRLVFLGGGNYPEPALMNKALTIEHPGGELVLGE